MVSILDTYRPAASAPAHTAPSVVRPHITVCICTFRRPNLLERLLTALSRQDTAERFTYGVVIVDNDRALSAQPVAEAARRYFSGRLVYRVEGRQNIALARNCALANATGDYLAFIDDDEFPEPHWLATLLAACERYGADGILAPVNPHFDQPPPPWLLKGGFFDRPQHPTGHRMEWHHCRTGNVLLKRSAIASSGLTFRAELGSGGEDRDFFRRLIGAGYTFVWCEEAAVSEVVPPSRWKRSTLLRRALLRGKMSLRQRSGRVRQVLASCVAVPAYVLALPFLALAGQHRSMKCLIKLCDHAGRLLAVLGLNPVTEVYVTE